jgi:hypothetical protein
MPSRFLRIHRLKCLISATHVKFSMQIKYKHKYKYSLKLLTNIRTAQGMKLYRPGFEPKLGHVGFEMDRVALGQVYSENFSLFSLPVVPPTAPHSSSIIRGWYNRPNTGRHAKWTNHQPPPPTVKNLISVSLF